MSATVKLMSVREGIQDKKRGAGFAKKTEELSVAAGCRKNPVMQDLVETGVGVSLDRER